MLKKKKTNLQKEKLNTLGVKEPINYYFREGLLEITYKFGSQSMLSNIFLQLDYFSLWF